MPISGLPVSLGTPVIDVPKSFIRRMESRRRFGEIRLRSHCFAGICAGHTGLCALLTVVSISVRRPARSFKAGKSLLLNAHDFATLPPHTEPKFHLVSYVQALQLCRLSLDPSLKTLWSHENDSSTDQRPAACHRPAATQNDGVKLRGSQTRGGRHGSGGENLSLCLQHRYRQVVGNRLANSPLSTQTSSDKNGWKTKPCPQVYPLNKPVSDVGHAEPASGSQSTMASLYTSAPHTP